MIKIFEEFLLESYNNSFFSQLKNSYYFKSSNWTPIMNSEKSTEKAKKTFNYFDTDSFKKWFSGSVVKNGDGSPMIVHHSSYDKFTKFKAPAFFGGNGTSNAYSGEYYYYCVLQLKNPLEMRSSELGRDEWMKRVGEMLKNSSRYESRIEFAEKYSDGYGFFKLLSGDKYGDPYIWPIVFDYIRKKGHDGMIYRETDQSIQWYFDGYIVMKPEQIKIIHVQED